MSLRSRTAPAETGASALLIALSMVVLMGLAAIAVDGGVAFDERRQQQSGADVGALAAAQFADTNLATANATCSALSGKAYAACRGAEEAIAVVDGTLPTTYSSADWLACSDPSKPARFTRVSALSPCISFTENFQEARVILPGVDVDTTFGAIIGFDEIAVGAFAEVGMDLDQSADVLPWAMGPTGAGSNYACLFANSTSNLNVDPCDGPAGGNFGKLDVSLYRNTTMGTPKICGNSMTQTKMEVNLITGADHVLEVASANPGVVNDWANCDNHGTAVDEVAVQTGNAQSGIKAGLFEGTTETDTDYEGRIICKNGNTQAGYEEFGDKDSYGNCQVIGNQFFEGVDDNALWDFLVSDPDQTWDSGAGMVDDTMCDSVTDHASMETCLQGWRDYATNVGPHVDGSGDPLGLFELSIREAPRFAAVPTLDSDPSGGTGDYLITDFKPVYIDTTYHKCNANTCDIAHSPGVAEQNSNCPNPITPADKSCGFGSSGNKNVIAITSFMLTVDMLHGDIQDKWPNRDGTVVYNLTR